MNQDVSELFERAQRVLPGGVNSPVRAMRQIGRDPIFIESGKGCEITDREGNTYIDWIFVATGSRVTKNFSELALDGERSGHAFYAAIAATTRSRGRHIVARRRLRGRCRAVATSCFARLSIARPAIIAIARAAIATLVATLIAARVPAAVA